MGGGLMQLVAYGAQDIYLTGQPQITFFKSVYRRHTNFAMESIAQTINGTAGFGSRVTLTISRNGDLLSGAVLEYSPFEVLGGVTAATNLGANVGHDLINTVELEIGGQLIDRQYGTWLTIWDYLTTPNPTGVQGVLSNTTGGEPTSDNTSINQDGQVSTLYDVMSYNHRGVSTATPLTNGTGSPSVAYVPLKFWFCRNPGLAIPLIALQYHEVKINILFNQQSAYMEPSTPTGTEFSSFKVYADYVYLDTTERRQFAQNAHEYLIDQLQVNQSTESNIRLTFNHPVKELIWIPTPEVVSAVQFSGGSSPSAPLTNGLYKITLNGTDRFSPRDLRYFTRQQVNTYHTGFGSVLWPNSVAVYSFGLRPEEHQPSGTCNFSRIDTAILVKPNSIQSINIYAVNYNVLRIMSGMGGLAYSN